MLLWRLLHTYPLAIFFIIFGYIHTYSKGVFKQKWISDPKKTKDETKLFQTIVNKRSIVNCYLKELHLRCYRRPSSLSGDTRKRFSDGKNWSIVWHKTRLMPSLSSIIPCQSALSVSFHQVSLFNKLASSHKKKKCNSIPHDLHKIHKRFNTFDSVVPTGLKWSYKLIQAYNHSFIVWFSLCFSMYAMHENMKIYALKLPSTSNYLIKLNNWNTWSKWEIKTVTNKDSRMTRGHTYF